MRRTPLYDHSGEPDDRDDAPNVRRITTSSTIRSAPRGDVRYMRGSRRPPPRRGPRWRTWIISAALGVAALSGVWLGLMLAFPPFERPSARATTPVVADPAQASATDPAAPVREPAPTVVAQPQPPAQPTAVSGPERLPGLPTAIPPTAVTLGEQPAAAPKPADGQVQAAAQPAGQQVAAAVEGAPTSQPAEQPAEAQTAAPAETPAVPAEAQAAPAETPAEGQPAAEATPAEQPAEGQESAPAEQPSETPAEGQPVAEAAQPAEGSAEGQVNAEQAAPEPEPPAQAEPAPATAAPVPPPEAPVRAEAPAPAPRTVAPAPAPAPPPPVRQQPAPKPAAPPPASGGAFALSASVSPANPISENAVVTVSVRATRGGAPVAGAFCMATIYYRTATVRQPAGGFTTGANGVGSFVLDAKGTTYGYTIPIDVTCSGPGGSATARTSFTPVRGR